MSNDKPLDKIIPVQTLPDGREIREFQNLKVQTWIDDALKTIPSNRRGAVILHATSDKKFAFTTVGYIDEAKRWTVITSIKAKPGTKLEAEGAIRFEW